ncbi:hypothetical protein TorRG33x02_106760 [Trema orientale]|uniref:Uncharacterized protein n=1 Tax=Trema orientale TaxID=63057 RepID=A0A2P5F6G7_TREOI|nr:hypothetical protein TorRG33x02_106760 [Trema orientale]
MIYGRHDEHSCLRLVQEISSRDSEKDDETENGTLLRPGLVPGSLINVIGEAQVMRTHVGHLQDNFKDSNLSLF